MEVLRSESSAGLYFDLVSQDVLKTDLKKKKRFVPSGATLTDFGDTFTHFGAKYDSHDQWWRTPRLLKQVATTLYVGKTLCVTTYCKHSGLFLLSIPSLLSLPPSLEWDFPMIRGKKLTTWHSSTGMSDFHPGWYKIKQTYDLKKKFPEHFCSASQNAPKPHL